MPNHVKLVEDASQPPNKDGTFISKDAMRYARRGFSRMRPVRPVIGAETRKLRLEECCREIEIVAEKYNSAVKQELACRSIREFKIKTANGALTDCKADKIAADKIAADKACTALDFEAGLPTR